MNRFINNKVINTEAKISTIIPCFNYGHLIAETINSILQQTYQNIEIIVVDDGSTDNTEAVVARIQATEKRVYYFKQENAGPSASRNFGISKSKGDYMQFLDADDVIEKRKFEIQLKIFEENSDVDIVYSSVRYFKKDAYNDADWLFTYWGENKEWMSKITGKGHDILQQAVKANFSHISSLLFKASIIKVIGAFDVTLRRAEDYQYLLRCAIANAYFYYHDTADSYSLVRWHGNNTSTNVNMMWAAEREMRIELMPLLINYPNASEINNNAIKSLSYQVGTSWKKHFLSGGKFDFIKKFIRLIGLEKLLLKVFYN